jgi:hypothetical protein
MNILILEASGHIRFSWESEHAISHFRHPLHFESSLAIQIGCFLAANSKPSQKIVEMFVNALRFKCDAI